MPSRARTPRRRAPDGASTVSTEEIVVPLAREELVVQKVLEPEERVRAQTHVTEREQEVETQVVRETIEIFRVPISLKEEVRLTKRRGVESRKVRVPVREEHVDIERLPPNTASGRRTT